MIVAILIGRRGSSGFPRKNTTPVHGQPMVYWPLKAAADAEDVGCTYVSTDDPEIANIANKFNAYVLPRPKELATTAALAEDVFVHAHNFIQKRAIQENFDVEFYVLLMANAVTVSSDQISYGIETLRLNKEADSLVTVSRYNMWSPLRARTIDSRGFLQPFVPYEVFGDPNEMNCDRDSQGDVWFADMGVSVIRPSNLDAIESGLLPQKWMGRRILPIYNEGGLDVDYPYQMPQAEYWLTQNASNNDT